MKSEFKEKPIEYIASFTLIISGVAATFLTDKWVPPVGGVLTAVGGALLSYTVSSIKGRNAAKTILEPELQSVSRHLADTIAKLSRVTQSFEADELDSQLAIDRVSQLRSTFYASLHDLYLLCGSSTNFESLVETVEVCEQTASKLSDLTRSTGGLENIEEIEQLRNQLSIARSQLQQLSQSYSSPPSKKEKVACPYCGGINEASVSVAKGPGATLTCVHCINRFHAHRLDSGRVESIPWGGMPKERIAVKCPSCNVNIPITLKDNDKEVVRFCLGCCERIRIKRDGTIIDHEATTPLISVEKERTGNRLYMTCPECQSTVPSLIIQDSIARGVCFECQKVLESDIAEQCN